MHPGLPGAPFLLILLAGVVAGIQSGEMQDPGTNTTTPAQEWAQFATTHWSIVPRAAASDTSTPAREALEVLCRAYWRPLYAFARGSGLSPEEAQDLVQGFFVRIIETKAVAKADRQQRRFRNFLLTAFKHFIAHERERAAALKRGGGHCPVSLDEFEPEERRGFEPVDARTPDVIFDQRWAQPQVENALHSVRADYVQASHGPLFDLLKAL